MPSGISQIATSAVRHVPVLAYQAVMTPGASWAVTPADFQTQTDWLQSQGYVPQKLSDFIRWMRGETALPKKSVVISFWYAHETVYQNAWPTLHSKNWPFNLMVPGSVVASEAQLLSGIYLKLSEIQEMVASGLAEVHSMGYHTVANYKGSALLAQQTYKSAQINLKWGGIEEEVEQAYSYAPLIGTNASLEPVTTTYAFTALPRSYRGSYLWPNPPLPSLTPTQIVARYLFIDQLSVQGTTPATPPQVTIKARQVGDAVWTTLKTGWTPSWTQGWDLVQLDTPFTFRTAVRHELRFETQSAAPQQGELVTLGSLTAEGYNGDDTTVTSNTAMMHLPFGSGAHEGGDICLLESLATETEGETEERAKMDAQKNIDFLAPYQPQGQRETGYAYTYNAFYNGSLFLPSTLRSLHPAQFWLATLITDRWSTLHFRNFTPAPVPEGWPHRQLCATYQVSGLRSNAQIQDTVDALSGARWDYAPDWDAWTVKLGYSHAYAPSYFVEAPKYSQVYTHLSTRALRFNADGSLASGSQDAGVSTLDNLKSWMQLEFVRTHPKVLAFIFNYNSDTQQFDADIARGVFQNANASVNAIITLLRDTLPTLAGVIIDLEGCYPADRSIASSWIQQLRQSMQAEVPGRLLINAIPAKTTDNPDDPWSGWCDYGHWATNCDYVNPLTYDFNWDNPGPIAPLSWIQQCLDFTDDYAARSKILIGFETYAHWAFWNGSAWTQLTALGYYDFVKKADEVGALWYWDDTNKENYFETAPVGGTYWRGYGATPRGFKARLDNFVAGGYAGFTVWAIGHGDALFYKHAEEIRAVAPLVKLPSGVGQRANDREGSGSLGQFDVDVLERAENLELSAPSFSWKHFGDLAHMMQQQQLHGKKARLRMGYVGINAPQFPVFDTLEVDRVEVNDDQTGWKLHLVDPKRSLKSRIFTTATNEAPVLLAGNPMDLLLVVYQNHLGIGQNPNLGSGAWLQYDPATGANLINPNRYVDVDTILAYRSGCFGNYHLEFSISEAQEGKAWLEREIYKVLGGYPVVDAAGRLSPRFWIVPPLAPLSGVFSFSDQNLVEMPVAERAPIINQVTVRMDYDGSKFQTVMSYVSGTSFSTYGLQGAHVIESRGLRAARQGIMHAGLLATKLFRRYDSIVPVWRVVAFHAALPVEVGDLVALTHPKVLDPITGQRGVSNVLCEVLEKQPDYSRARISFKLLDVRYLAGKSAYGIAAGGAVPDWPAASQQQKDTYMFVASDSSGQYSDGVAGNPIYG